MNREVRRRHDAMREAAALLSEVSSLPPPADVRARLLHRARATRRVTDVAASDPIDVYEHQIDSLHALLTTLRGDEWTAVAAPYVWSVHALVAHLLVIER